MQSNLLYRVLEASHAFVALSNESFVAEDAAFVRNRAVPQVWDANHVSNVRVPTPAGFDRLLARIEEEFSGFSHRCIDVDPLTPAFVEARLVMEGYTPHSLLAMVLEGELAKPAPLCDIRSVDSSEGWQDYETLFRADAQGWLERPGGEHAFPVADALLEIRRLKERAGVRFWIAYAEGRPASYLCNAATPNGVGQVEDLFTHPDYRRRGLATALLAHCVADCRAAGAREVFLWADPDDTPKFMYQSLGFQPLAIIREYWKPVEVGAT